MVNNLNLQPNISVSKFQSMINNINQSKYFYGFLMILLNVGAKYIEMDIPGSHKKFLSSKLIRRLLIYNKSKIY